MIQRFSLIPISAKATTPQEIALEYQMIVNRHLKKNLQDYHLEIIKGRYFVGLHFVKDEIDLSFLDNA